VTKVSKDTDYLFCISADSLGVQGRKVQASGVDGCRQVIYSELFLLLNLVYFLNGNQHHSRAKSLRRSLKSHTCYYVLNLDFTFTSLQVWAGPLSGNRLVVALWNRCSKVATITASWEALGLESGIHVSVRDLWQVS